MAETSRVLEVGLTLRDNLTAAAQQTFQKIRGFGASVGSAFDSLKSKIFNLRNAILGLGIGFAIKQTFDLIKSVADTGDELLATSQKTGLAVEQLSKLKFAAEQSNLEFQSLAKALVMLQKNLGELQRSGGGPAAQALELLGGEFERAHKEGRSLEEQLQALAVDFEALEGQEEKVLVATKLFGKEGAALIPLLREGKKGIAELMEQAERLGAVWSEKDAKAADEFGDALNRLQTSLRATAEAVAKPLLPAFAQLFDKLTVFVRDHQDEVLQFFIGLLEVGKRASETLGPALERLGESAKQAIAPFLDLREAMLQIEIGQQGRIVDQLEGRFPGIAAGRDPLFKRLEIFKQIEAERQKLAELREEYARLDRIRRFGLAPAPAGPDAGFFDSAIAESELALAALRERQRSQLEADFRRQVALHQGTFQQPPGPLLESAPIARQDTVEAVLKPIEKTRTAVDGVTTALDELALRGQDSFTLLREGTLATADALTDQLAAGIVEAGSNFENFGEVVRDTGRGILRTLTNILIKIALVRALGAAIGAFTNKSDAVDVLKNDPDLEFLRTNTGATDSHFADSFAASGVRYTTGPTIAGEAGPELISPLGGAYGGRGANILEGAGGGGMVVQNFITIEATDAESFDRLMRASAGRQADFLARLNAAQWTQNPALRAKYR